MTNTDKIIEKVKGLLAIAKDKKRDEGTKSAITNGSKINGYKKGSLMAFGQGELGA